MRCKDVGDFGQLWEIHNGSYFSGGCTLLRPRRNVQNYSLMKLVTKTTPRRRCPAFLLFFFFIYNFFFPSEFSFPDTQRDKYSTERKYSISPSLRCTSLVQEEKQSAKRKKNSTPPSQNCRDSSEQVRTQVRPGRLNPKRLSSAAPPLLCRQVRKRSALRHYIPSATSLDST